MTTDMLAAMLAAQNRLQIDSFKNNPRELIGNNNRHAPQAVDFISWNVLAMEDELHELLAETGWKPWATSKHVNVDAARSELIDALHFFMNIALALDMSADDIFDGYAAKRAKNAHRQANGYDGVTGKCPGCKRALDDNAVKCTFTDNEYWCTNIGWINEHGVAL